MSNSKKVELVAIKTKTSQGNKGSPKFTCTRRLLRNIRKKAERTPRQGTNGRILGLQMGVNINAEQPRQTTWDKSGIPGTHNAPVVKSRAGERDIGLLVCAVTALSATSTKARELICASAHKAPVVKMPHWWLGVVPHALCAKASTACCVLCGKERRGISCVHRSG